MADPPTRPMVHTFVVPPLDGPPTGGTLYNVNLITALQRAGLDCRVVSLTSDGGAPSADEGGVYWIDSLYMAALPRLRGSLPGAQLRLLLHYLPSLVRVGRPLHRDDLTTVERGALDAAEGHLVTSEFMKRQLERLALPHPKPRVVCVEPGVSAFAGPLLRQEAYVHDEVRGVMLCNLVEGKGVLPFLEALSHRLRPSDRFRLRIAGSLEQEADYARACRRLIDAAPSLCERVALLGPLPPAQALAELSAADALLSASRMESYGMALAEARALGVPILARVGGNVAAHVEAAAGGLLVADEHELAGAFVGVVRATAALAARRDAARAAIRSRSWDQAAADFIAQC